MNEHDFAMRCLRRARGGAFTLPELDDDYTIARLIELRITDHLDYLTHTTLPYQQRMNFPTVETEAKIAELEALRDDVNAYLVLGELTAEQHALIMTPAHTRTAAQRDEISRRYNVGRYIPQWIMNDGEGALYYLLADNAQPIELRFENGEWNRPTGARHDG